MKYILFSLLTLNAIVAFGQIHPSDEIKVNDTAFLSFLESRIIENFHSRLSNIGEWGICWIKIEVSAQNKVLDISISTGTNHVFASFLKSVLAQTNDKWAFPTKFGPNNNKLLIIPLWYNLQKDGRAKKVENNEEQIISFLSPKADLPQQVILFPKLQYMSPFQ